MKIQRSPGIGSACEVGGIVNNYDDIGMLRLIGHCRWAQIEHTAEFLREVRSFLFGPGLADARASLTTTT